MPEFIVADGRKFYDGQTMHYAGERIFIHPDDYKVHLPGQGVLVPIDQEGADALKWSPADVKRIFPDGFPEKQEPKPPAPEPELSDEERVLRARLPPAQQAARAANIRFNEENPDHKPWVVPENANAPAQVSAVAAPGEAITVGGGPRPPETTPLGESATGAPQASEQTPNLPPAEQRNPPGIVPGSESNPVPAPAGAIAGPTTAKR